MTKINTETEESTIYVTYYLYLALNIFSDGNSIKKIRKKLLLGITRVKIVLLNNTTIRNTSSGYQPFYFFLTLAKYIFSQEFLHKLVFRLLFLRQIKFGFGNFIFSL